MKTMKTKTKTTEIDAIRCCTGAKLFRVDGSRLEDFLGHQLYRCEKCRQLWKIKDDSEPWRVVEFQSGP